MKWASLSMLLAVILTVVAVHLISAGAKTVVSVSGEKAFVCVDCAEGAERDSLISSPTSAIITPISSSNEDNAYAHLYTVMDKYASGDALRLLDSYEPTSTWEPEPTPTRESEPTPTREPELTPTR